MHVCAYLVLLCARDEKVNRQKQNAGPQSTLHACRSTGETLACTLAESSCNTRMPARGSDTHSHINDSCSSGGYERLRSLCGVVTKE